MRRPIVVIFICFSAGCVLTWNGQDHWFWLFTGSLVCSCCVLMYFKMKERGSLLSVSVAIASLLCGMISMSAELSRPEPLLAQIGKSVAVTGVVVSEKESDYGRSLLIRPSESELDLISKIQRRKIWVYVNSSEDTENRQYEPWTGWKITITGTVKEPGFPRNPGSFDQRMYLRTLGAQVILESDDHDIIILEDRTAISARIRTLLEEKWEPLMGERNCSGLMGLMFGASDAMDDETLEAFQTIGLGHLLAVSGLHVGLVYGAVQSMLGERGNTVLAQVICSFSVILYAALAGFSASATRAALMIVIHGIGQTLYRPYDMVTSAAVAGMVILTRQPCQILSSGFQLSMLAAFGLACVLPRLSYSAELWADRKRSNVLRWITDKITPMAAIQLVMGPICARRFHCFSLWSLGLNPICIAISGMLIPLTMGLALITVGMECLADHPMFGWIAPVCSSLAWLAGSLMAGMMNLGEVAAEIPGTIVTAGLPPGLLGLYYCGLFSWSSETLYLLIRKKKVSLVKFWIAAMVLGCHLLPWWMGLSTDPSLISYLDYPVVFVDVGQGDCIHIQTPKGKNILIDGGGSQSKNVGKDTLLPYLLHRGVKRIDLALATHLHMDHAQGLYELAQAIPITQFGTYEANRFREGLAEMEYVYLKEGDRIRLEPGIWIDVLAPPQRTTEEYERLAKDDSDENDSCLVFMIHYDELEILVTGDMGMEGERALLKDQKDVCADILKVGHHGSKYSTSEAFLEAVGPNVAVISVGTNYFGHPSDRVIELLEKNDIIVGRTDQNGAVIVRSIGPKGTELRSGNGELQWRIVQRENK